MMATDVKPVERQQGPWTLGGMLRFTLRDYLLTVRPVQNLLGQEMLYQFIKLDFINMCNF